MNTNRARVAIHNPSMRTLDEEFVRPANGASMMLVGEQPGDYEDVAGKPFVEPSGKIMDRALEEAGIRTFRRRFARSTESSGGLDGRLSFRQRQRRSRTRLVAAESRRCFSISSASGKSRG